MSTPVAPSSLSSFDLIGVGAPIMDLVATVPESFLEHTAGDKGGSVNISPDEIARLIAQRFKLGQAISDGGALGDEICAHVAERFLQLPISQSGAGVFPELWRCRISCHVEKAFMADCPN